MTYSIFENKSYHCTFYVQVLGNTDTTKGNVPGSFIATGEVNTVLLTFEDDTISPQITSIGGNTQISFTIQSSLQPGSEYELYGSYSGSTLPNEVVSLGIDWGKRVSLLQTFIYLERGLVLLEVDPQPERISVVAGGKLQLSWTDIDKQSFLATIDFSSESSTNVMAANINTWTITSTKPLIVTIQSYVNYELHCHVITPSWINANITQFKIESKGIKAVSFTLSDILPPRGTTGVIQINARETLTKLEIPVEIARSSSSDPLLTSLIAAFIGSGIFFATVLLMQNRQLVIKKISELKTSIIRTTTSKTQQRVATDMSQNTGPQVIQGIEQMRDKTPWKTVEDKWRNFLTENELSVLRLLYGGSMNQQTLANELSISKSAMSRMLSKLELKRLIIREKEGMSNMVNLNWETL